MFSSEISRSLKWISMIFYGYRFPKTSPKSLSNILPYMKFYDCIFLWYILVHKDSMTLVFRLHVIADSIHFHRNRDVFRHILLIWNRFYEHGLTLIPTWISNHMPSEVWDEMTHPFPNVSSRNLIHTLWRTYLLIHAQINCNPCYKKGPLVSACVHSRTPVACRKWDTDAISWFQIRAILHPYLHPLSGSHGPSSLKTNLRCRKRTRMRKPDVNDTGGRV